PVDQTCVVASGTGSVTTANIATVAITCTDNRYTIGGTVTGLSGTLVLRNNSGDDLTIGADGVFTFATSLLNNAAYNVTVLSKPATQECAVALGSGTVAAANVTNVAVTCTTIVCGDNVHQGTEVCDGADLAGASCGSLGQLPGTLTCNGTCTGYDSSGC